MKECSKNNSTHISYQIIKSNRKTIAIHIKPDGEVVVRCPRGMSKREINAFVERKASWIQKHLAAISHEPAVKFTEQELEELKEKTRQLVTERVEYFAPILGVTCNRITIRTQHTRWGSCSCKGNLNFNALLALVPAEVLDYIVVHELCHRIEMNHSSRFWNEVGKILPDYPLCQKWLKEHGSRLIARL